MEILKNMYKFTNTNQNIEDSKVYKCMKAANEGKIKEFKKLYKELSQGSFGAEYLKKGKYRLLGYEFNFQPYLKKYLVNFRYKNDYEVIYALNKSNITDNCHITKYSIVDIVEA